VPTGWDPYETAIAIILGQLVSVPQGTRLVSELIDFYGEPSDLVIDQQRINLFPTVERIAGSDLAKLKTTGSKKKTLNEFSKAILKGSVSLESTQNMDDFRLKLLEIKGIGQWTADCMALKVLGHADAFPSSDLILARALDLHPQKTIERLTPWRGYAAMLLWSEYAHQLKKKQDNPMDKIQYEMTSPVGPLYLVASEHAVHGLFFTKRNMPLVKFWDRRCRQKRY